MMDRLSQFIATVQSSSSSNDQVGKHPSDGSRQGDASFDDRGIPEWTVIAKIEKSYDDCNFQNAEQIKNLETNLLEAMQRDEVGIAKIKVKGIPVLAIREGRKDRPRSQYLVIVFEEDKPEVRERYECRKEVDAAMLIQRAGTRVMSLGY